MKAQLISWEVIRNLAPLSAKTITDTFGLDQDFPVDVEGLAVVLGIDVQYTQGEEEGHLDLDDSAAVIKISDRIAKGRKRFIIAHEIGHLALGHNHTLCAYQPWEVEKSANRFAAALLMPEDRMRIVAQALRSVEDMAGYFNVSTDAVIYRLKTLGIVDQ